MSNLNNKYTKKRLLSLLSILKKFCVDRKGFIFDVVSAVYLMSRFLVLFFKIYWDNTIIIIIQVLTFMLNPDKHIGILVVSLLCTVHYIKYPQLIFDRTFFYQISSDLVLRILLSEKSLSLSTTTQQNTDFLCLVFSRIQSYFVGN